MIVCIDRYVSFRYLTIGLVFLNLLGVWNDSNS